MTDDRMDALLHEVGDRWRAANTDAANTDAASVPDIDDARRPAVRARTRVALVVSAAAVAAALVVGLVVTIAGLGDDDRPTVSGGLTGTVWRLTTDGRPAASNASLYVASDGRLVADDDCTVVGAQVRRDGGQLFPTDIETRPRGCTDQTGPGLGDDFVELLAGFPTYEVRGDRLTIGRGDARREFVADPALPRPTLDVPSVLEARWRLTGVRNGTGEDLPAPDGVAFRIVDTRLTTSDGCNTITAQAGPSGTGLAIKNVTRTELGCTSGADARAVIDAVFDGTVDAKVVGNRLTLTGDGTGTLTYEWVPDDTAATDPAQLVGPTWRLTGVVGDPPAAASSLRFPTSTSYEANTGCGRFGGAAALGAGSMRLADVPDDQPGCAAQARTVTGFLGNNPLWAVRDGKLLVFGGGSQAFSLVYAGGVVNQATSSLIGSWTVFSVEPLGGGGASGGALPTITFRAGSYRIEGLCSDRGGRWTATGSELTVDPDGFRTCQDAGAYAAAAADVMSGRITYGIDGATLTLERDGTTLRLTKQ